MKKVIHINQHVIKKNRITGNRNPAITVKTYKENNYAHEVIVNGPCRVVYRPDKPLSCGAVCWLETDSEVQLISHLAKECIPLDDSVEGCSYQQ